MCRFLARWCPNEADGGRQGRNAYEQMRQSVRWSSTELTPSEVIEYFFSAL